MLAVGTLFIFSSPSGGGKTSLVNGVLSELSNMMISVSHTTRAPRPGEVDGKHYHFISEEEFDALKSAGEFLEDAYVYGHHYGTSRKWVMDTLQGGNDVVLDIDWQGARQVKEQFPGATAIYILPPSREVLLSRLRKRDQDENGVIDYRMANLAQEVSHCGEYDYLIVNDVFENSVGLAKRIIEVSRLKVANQEIVYKNVIADLLGENY